MQIFFSGYFNILYLGNKGLEMTCRIKILLSVKRIPFITEHPVFKMFKNLLQNITCNSPRGYVSDSSWYDSVFSYYILLRCYVFLVINMLYVFHGHLIWWFNYASEENYLEKWNIYCLASLITKSVKKVCGK